MTEPKTEHGANCGHPNHRGPDHDCTGFLPCGDAGCPCGPRTESDRKPLRLGDPRTWGETTCGFGLTVPECHAPATRHFMWLTDSSTSPACDEHAAYIHSRDTTATPFDEHTHGPDCGMPGALWRFAYEDQDEGYCFFPAVDDASLLAEESKPLVLSTSPATTDGGA